MQQPSEAGGRSWGGRRPGAGRKPKLQVVPGSSTSSPAQGPTLGSALNNLRGAAPPLGATPPSAPPGEPPGEAAPPAGAIKPENESFANLTAYVATNVGVLLIRDSIRKGGHEPHEPDPSDIERTSDATAKAIAIGIGDAQIPWWGTLLASWGSLYLSMRLGAPANDNASAARPPAAPGAVVTPPPPAPPAQPAPVLGQGVAQPQRSSAFAPLPEVAVYGT